MLKQLIILLAKKNEQLILDKYVSALQALKTDMAKQDIMIFLRFVEDANSQDGSSQVADGSTNDGHILDGEDIQNDCINAVGTLYITDTPAHLDMLKLWGYPAVALIHDYNRDVSFRNADYLIEGLEGLEYSYLDKVYRRLAGLPWDILETERLYVRESTVKDVDDFYRIYKEPSITYYMENLFEEPDMERMYMKNYIRRVYGFYEYGMWTVILKETGQVIGRAGLSVRDGYELPELGFVIEVEHQRRGYATEVCRAILTYAVEELQMEGVQALVCEENKASLSLLKNLGFSYRENVTEGGQDYQLWINDLIGEAK